MEISKYSTITEEEKVIVLQLVPEGCELIKITESLCPGCIEEKKWNEMKKHAVVYKEGNSVIIAKVCKKHGTTKDVYWNDYEMFKRAEQYADRGVKIETPHIKVDKIDCPKNCGLCKEHESHTNLLNIVATNRCDLSCWYCFFYAKKDGEIYEPTIEQVRTMLERAKNVKPVGANAVQFTGGEPTLRDDIIEMIKIAKELGYDHVQLNTNGIRLAKEPEFCKRIREAGVNTLYLSFDGVTPKTNPKNYWEVPDAIKNCRTAGIGVVLVPTLINTVNDHEIGDIIRFAKGNIDVIRGVNFQPVSFVGSMPQATREKQRITIPDAIKKVEEQTNGEISAEDFYPVPCVCAITDFIEAIQEKPRYRLSTHFACGAATYVFIDGGRLVPITKFFDVEGFFEYLNELTKDIKGSSIKKVVKTIAIGKLLLKIRSFIDEEKKPKWLNLLSLIKSALIGADYKGLGEFHHKSLFIGMMHFQDPYNWDVDRVHKCTIHYGSPDGRIIPFCAFNVIPELYRDKIQRKFSIPTDEWEKKTGKRLEEEKYKRVVNEDMKKEIKKFYERSIGGKNGD